MAGGKHNNEALLLGLPCRQSRAILGIDSYQSTVTGPYLDQFVDLRQIVSSYRGNPVIPEGKSHEIVVCVRNSGLTMTSDGHSCHSLDRESS